MLIFLIHNLIMYLLIGLIIGSFVFIKETKSGDLKGMKPLRVIVKTIKLILLWLPLLVLASGILE